MRLKLLSRLTWCGLLGAIAWLVAATAARAADEDPFAGQMRALLEKGFDRQQRLPVVRSYYETAQRLQPFDPRPDYAWGLVCLKRQANDDARQALATALQQPAALGPAGCQAAIRVLVQQGQYDQTLDALAAYGRALGQPKLLPLGVEQRQQSAAWLGRMMAYLALPTVCPAKLRERLTATEQALAASLGGELQPVYLQGKRQLTADVQKEQEAQGLKAEAKDEKEVEKAEAKAVREAVLKERRVEETEKHDKRVQMAQQEFEQTLQQFNDELDALAVAYVDLVAEVRQYQQTPTPHYRNMHADWRHYLDAVSEQLTQIEKRGKVLTQARSRFLAQNRQLAQQLAVQGAQLDDWQKRVKLAEGAPSRAPGGGKPDKAAIEALNRLFPFDLDAEKQRLLDAVKAR